MYIVERVDIDNLYELEKNGQIHTIFMTRAWIDFLQKNQNAEPILLEFCNAEKKVQGYFLGMLIKKMGIKILGSPFEGWLTCDMGFIRVDELDINLALKSVANFAFKKLKCFYVQIIDKNIDLHSLDEEIKLDISRELYMDISQPKDVLLSNFTKRTRKDIRQFDNRGAIIKQVPFDDDFVDMFYDQLLDVFAKQNLKPNYSKKKILDLSNSLRRCPDNVLALQVYSPNDECIASSLTFGYGKWCYSMATASYRFGQRFLPNEKIRWETIKYWKNKGVNNYDLCGYREYKLKFNPIIREIPVIYFERFHGIHFLKNVFKNGVKIFRKIKGIITK